MHDGSRVQDLVDYHRERAQAGQRLMVLFLAFLMVLFLFRIAQYVLEGSQHLAVVDVQTAYKEVARLQEQLKRLEYREVLLTDPRVPDSFSRGFTFGDDLESIFPDLGRDGDDTEWLFQQASRNMYEPRCRRYDGHLRTLAIGEAVGARLRERLAGTDQVVIGRICSPSEMAVLAAVSETLDPILQRSDPGAQYASCLPGEEQSLRRLMEVTSPSSFPTFNPERAFEEKCVLALGYLRRIRESYFGLDAEALATIRGDLEVALQNGKTSLASLGPEKEALSTKISGLSKGIADKSTSGMQSLLLELGRISWIYLLLSAAALVGVNAGYQQSRSHTFEAVQIARREHSLDLLQRATAVGATLSPEVIHDFLLADPVNPFSPRVRGSELRAPHDRAAADLSTLLRDEIPTLRKSLVESVRDVVRRPKGGKSNSGQRGAGA